MDIKKSITKLSKDLKAWYFALRNEPEAIEQLRLLILGIITCLVIFYGGNELLLRPMADSFNEKLAKQLGLQGSIQASGPVDNAALLQQLMQKKASLKQQIEQLTVNRDLLREQWGLLGDASRFAEIIFTLKPAAPVHIEENLEQMTVAQARPSSLGMLYPVTLSGTADFARLFNYLQYLERHHEVGLIDNLEIKLIDGTSDLERADVRFSLLLGRMELGAEKNT